MKLRSGTVVNAIMSDRTTNASSSREMDHVRDTIPNLGTNSAVDTVIEYVEDTYDSESEMAEARDEEIVADIGSESVESPNLFIVLMLREMKKMEERSEQNMKKMEERMKQDRLEQSKRDKQDLMNKMEENSKKMEERLERNMVKKIEEQAAQSKLDKQDMMEKMEESIRYQFEAQDRKWDSRVSDIMKLFNVVKTEGYPTEGLAEENVEKSESYVEGEEQEIEILSEEFEDAKDERHEKMIQIDEEIEVKKLTENPLVTVERKSDNCDISIIEELKNDGLDRIQEEMLVQIELRMGENPREIPEITGNGYEVEEEKDMNYAEVKQSFINIYMSYDKREEILRKLYVFNFDRNIMCRDQHLQEVYNEIKQLHCPLTTPLFLLLYAS